jgi:23S rRNA (adenine2503-C2)-methyltransferase
MIETSSKKIDIRKLTVIELTAMLTAIGEKPFRAKQIYEWLWKKSAGSFEEMTNLSLKTREWLNENFVFHKASFDQRQVSSDKTIKYTFSLFDGNQVEGVLIPAKTRMTACISSQVGCSLSCKFCATGYMERKRNLESGEIYDQAVMISNQAEEVYGIPLTNIVYMGMGEPLLNYANVMRSIEYITSPEGLGMSTKRITLSTAGIAKMIKKLGDDGVKFNLALSLHAANDEKRNQIMPINETNTLASLKEALTDFYLKTKNKITLEYIALREFNDTLTDAQELYRFAKTIPCNINIIEYNPIEQASFAKSSEESVEKFGQYLEDKGLIVNIRKSRGKDIDAACGQLAGKK